MAVVDGIECIESKAIQGDNYVGLACDEDNFYDNTDPMIEKWTSYPRKHNNRVYPPTHTYTLTMPPIN